MDQENLSRLPSDLVQPKEQVMSMLLTSKGLCCGLMLHITSLAVLYFTSLIQLSAASSAFGINYQLKDAAINLDLLSERFYISPALSQTELAVPFELQR